MDTITIQQSIFPNLLTAPVPMTNTLPGAEDVYNPNDDDVPDGDEDEPL